MTGRIEFHSERPSWRRRGRLVLGWLAATVVVQLVVSLWPGPVEGLGLTVGLVCGFALMVLVGLAFVPGPANTLVIEPEGLRSTFRTQFHPWTDVAAIWVGGQRSWKGFDWLGLSSRSMRIYTRGELAFDQRAGGRLHAPVLVPVPAGVTAEQVVDAVGRFSTTPVVVGDHQARRELERQLTGQA